MAKAKLTAALQMLQTLAAPSAPAPADTGSQAKADAAKNEKLTLAEVEAKTPADRIQMFKDMVIKPFAAIDKARKAATRKIHLAVIITAAMKRLYVARFNAHEITPDTIESQFFKDNGGDVPPRVKSLAGVYNALVLMKDGNEKPLLMEELFLKTSGASLDKVAGILKAVKAACKITGADWRGHNATLDMLDVLCNPSEETPEKLVAIRKTLGGKDDTETEVVAIPALTVARAVEFLKAKMTEAPKSTPDEQYELCCGVWEINGAWSDLPDELLKANDERYQAAQKASVAPHLQVISEQAETKPEEKTEALAA